MIPFLADENFNLDIVTGLLSRNPKADFATIADEGMRGATDPDVLAWAAQTGRVVLTHDHNTMPAHAYERVSRGEAMAGLFLVQMHAPVGLIVETLFTIDACSDVAEWRDRVTYLPLR